MSQREGLRPRQKSEGECFRNEMVLWQQCSPLSQGACSGRPASLRRKGVGCFHLLHYSPRRTLKSPERAVKDGRVLAEDKGGKKPGVCGTLPVS